MQWKQYTLCPFSPQWKCRRHIRPPAAVRPKLSPILNYFEDTYIGRPQHKDIGQLDHQRQTERARFECYDTSFRTLRIYILKSSQICRIIHHLIFIWRVIRYFGVNNICVRTIGYHNLKIGTYVSTNCIHVPHVLITMYADKAAHRPVPTGPKPVFLRVTDVRNTDRKALSGEELYLSIANTVYQGNIVGVQLHFCNS